MHESAFIFYETRPSATFRENVEHLELKALSK
jgi:hypothetical protein